MTGLKIIALSFLLLFLPDKRRSDPDKEAYRKVSSPGTRWGLKPGFTTTLPPTRVQLRTHVDVICIVTQLLLLAKASEVAVAAPDGAWPRADHEGASFVGLFNM